MASHVASVPGRHLMQREYYISKQAVHFTIPPSRPTSHAQRCTVVLLLHCRNSQHTVLGFAWGSSDEKKMQKSFGLGRQQLFDRFLDLQLVTQGLGYQMMGLTKLTETVLGCPNHKSKKVMPLSCCCPHCPRPLLVLGKPGKQTALVTAAAKQQQQPSMRERHSTWLL